MLKGLFGITTFEITAMSIVGCSGLLLFIKASAQL